MSDDPEPLSEAERRRLRARVFGDVLPSATRDERADDAPDRGEGPAVRDAGDDWLRSQVPPHHG